MKEKSEKNKNTLMNSQIKHSSEASINSSKKVSKNETISTKIVAPTNSKNLKIVIENNDKKILENQVF